MKRKRSPRVAIERFAQRVRELQRELQPELPDVDPDDLNLILDCMLKPPRQRLYFIYPLPGGGYGF